MSNDLIQWVRFFLNGIAQTAAKGREVFWQILVLRTEVEQSTMGMGKRAATALQALNFLYRYCKLVIKDSNLERALEMTTPRPMP